MLMYYKVKHHKDQLTKSAKIIYKDCKLFTMTMATTMRGYFFLEMSLFIKSIFVFIVFSFIYLFNNLFKVDKFTKIQYIYT